MKYKGYRINFRKSRHSDVYLFVIKDLDGVTLISTFVKTIQTGVEWVVEVINRQYFKETRYPYVHDLWEEYQK